MDERMTSAAMSIIMSAGDARLKITEAFADMTQLDYESAAQKLKDAQKHMTDAHRVQTDMIQGEAQGETMAFSLLFAHAQDTLMTINSELVMAKQLFRVFESFETRLARLEKEMATHDQA